MPNITFIAGPTAAGKSELAFKIARKTKAEIVSCDSMLVYKEPQIITSKPPEYMLEGVRHHFINIITVSESYNVFDYYTEAVKLIAGLFAKGVPVVVCGGSGLYMSALLDGIFQGPSRNDELRLSLEEEAREKGSSVLYEKLKFVDPEAAYKISSNDLKRIVRALEVYYTLGVPISEKQKEKKGIWGKYPIRIFGLAMERRVLYERINQRTKQMFKKGAVKEVENLLKLPLSITAGKIIGINEIKGYLKGEYSLDYAESLMAKNTRNYAKRQLTWFRRDSRIEWVDAEGGIKNLENDILKVIK